MGKLIVTQFMTLDGVARAPGGHDEDRDGDLTHGGWHAPLRDEEVAGVVFDQARSMDGLLLGRGKHVFADGTVPAALRLTESVTYANGIPHWPTSPSARPRTATCEITRERDQRGRSVLRVPLMIQ